MHRQMKYICFEYEGMDFFVTFTQWVEHDKFAEMFSSDYKPIRAGFVEMIGGRLYCIGESVSLNLKSHPDDSAALRRQLGYGD